MFTDEQGTSDLRHRGRKGLGHNFGRRKDFTQVNIFTQRQKDIQPTCYGVSGQHWCRLSVAVNYCRLIALSGHFCVRVCVYVHVLLAVYPSLCGANHYSHAFFNQSSLTISDPSNTLTHKHTLAECKWLGLLIFFLWCIVIVLWVMIYCNSKSHIYPTIMFETRVKCVYVCVSGRWARYHPISITQTTIRQPQDQTP